MKLEFARRIFQKAWLSKLTKIRPVGFRLFHADGRYESMSCFSQFFERAYKQHPPDVVHPDWFVDELGLYAYVTGEMTSLV